MRVVAVVACLMISTAVLYGDEPQQQNRRPWEWSEEERIRMRVDPAAISERLAQYEERERESARGLGRAPAPQRMRDQIAGREHPEVWLPFELFRALYRDLENIMAGRKPVHGGREIDSAGFDATTFWSRLEMACGPVTRLRVRERELAAQFDTAKPSRRRELETEYSDVSRAICRAEFEALQRARAQFGGVGFDRFLYTVIAPSLGGAGFDIAATEQERSQQAELLRALAGGCR